RFHMSFPVLGLNQLPNLLVEIGCSTHFPVLELDQEKFTGSPFSFQRYQGDRTVFRPFYLVSAMALPFEVGRFSVQLGEDLRWVQGNDEIMEGIILHLAHCSVRENDSILAVG